MNRLARSPARSRRYLWAIGEGVATLSSRSLFRDRYRIIAPQIWLDTQPEQQPPVPDELPALAVLYGQAYPYQLHIPQVYGVITRVIASPILLLENSPIHPQSGELLPTLEELWPQATDARRLHWLWQLWELWFNLNTIGVASSLDALGNVHIEGWRVRIRELKRDSTAPSLGQLALLWQPLIQALPRALGERLEAIAADMMTLRVAPELIGERLNQVLLQTQSQTAVRVSMAGGTTAGPRLPRNEDSCHPDDQRVHRSEVLAVVCDGVGGHEGGEVASQMAVQSLRLQLRGLLEAAQLEQQVLSPRVVEQQLQAVIRVANDLINRQNDLQVRSERQRMGTTLALALRFTQRLQTEDGWDTVDEIYLAHVGDSRIYWITPDYCHQLTVDDDLAGRQVQAGRQLLATAQSRPEAGALTQAVGTRGAQYLKPHIQRFLVSEPGLLLLCSDGLSDHRRVEESWANYIGLITKDIVALDVALATWLELANQKNGHDNTAVVLMHCRTALKQPVAMPTEFGEPLTAASRMLLYGEADPGDVDVDVEAESPQVTPLGAGMPRWGWVLVAGFLAAVALGAWLLLGQSPTVEPEPGPGLEQRES